MNDQGYPLDELETKIDDVEREVRKVPSKEHVDAVDKRTSLHTKMAVVACLVIALLGFGLSIWNSAVTAHNSARAAITEDGLESLRAANDKLREQGLPQIKVPEAGQPIDSDALAAAVAAIVKADIVGDPAFRGPRGRQGDPCVPAVPGCTGDTGQPGSSGPGGPEGATGDQGLQGDQGEQGEKGDMGEPCLPSNPACVGPVGPPGPPGPNCDPGFTARSRPAPVPYLGETWWVCTSAQE